LAPANFAESGATVKAARGRIFFTHFKEHGAGAKPRQSAKMGIEQRACIAASTISRRNRDRQDFRFARHE
jgi:hypothetical protein